MSGAVFRERVQTPGEPEQFFRLDKKALGLARAKLRPATRLGWAVQWGTVRIFGIFLIEDSTMVPASARSRRSDDDCSRRQPLC
ncbi:DUF4158 domain-containing protein [Sciscionella sediminilitoris]|uniref:DUF4158 domain-containing protein n=1 Tax=Sciscionella sediminilitoris TaxID=1445613 RepID=UPI003CCD9A0C